MHPPPLTTLGHSTSIYSYFHPNSDAPSTFPHTRLSVTRLPDVCTLPHTPTQDSDVPSTFPHTRLSLIGFQILTSPTHDTDFPSTFPHTRFWWPMYLPSHTTLVTRLPDICTLPLSRLMSYLPSPYPILGHSTSRCMPFPTHDSQVPLAFPHTWFSKICSNILKVQYTFS